MIRTYFVLLFLLSSGVLAAETAVERLVTHELSFAQTASEKGTHAAFLSFLAERSIVFRPFPVDARKWYQENPDSGGLLSWRPAYAEMSSSGDFGFTTGPWKFHKKRGEPPIAFGQFVSIWKRQQNGLWRVVLDAGTFQEQAQLSAQDVEKLQHPVGTDTRGIQQPLLEKELEVVRRISQEGQPAITTYAAESAFLLRNGLPPIRGNKAIAQHLNRKTTAWKYEQIGHDVSADKTLGYTYGTYRNTESGESGSYLRVWRNENGWKIALDLAAPASEE